MPTWDIAARPVAEQFAVWHEVICQAFVPLTPTRTATDVPGFAARVETRGLGAVNRALIDSQPQLTAHGPREVARSDGEYVFVNLQLAGRCHVRTGAVESTVGPGRLVVLDTTEPYHLAFDEPWRMLSFRVPHRALGGRPRQAGLGHVVDGATGTGLVVSTLMRSLWRWQETGAAPDDLERSFASVVSAAIGGPVEQPARAGLRAAVLRHVASRLGDPDLSVTSVARRFAVSPRTLHAAFAEHETTFAATVRTMRLERCARALTDPAERGTITEIAARYGYRDPSAFSRAFRREYGTAPRDARG
ncbi:helix-turn-helix domain-containing protein [Pseudonocardia benzenivorans]|uniref:Transcriptional regulator, AraC family n=2 Tax=Pseudonocardia TaxID=1847 RepID=F4CPN2_PSEUX|nr:helix-turn-helix domain-containing protein [Pseudonocardia dioxanivorans]AEA25149.1 transcriptional regulator, AraC family [Pseudonocardia dioxanivorans CB1190]GJF03927.1 transcriptional regulator [Pseudonocardia sp. D17]